MNEEELSLHFLQEYYNIPTHWENYITIKNAIQENQQLKQQLQQKEDIINKAKVFINDYKEQWVKDDDVQKDMNELLKILDNKGE